MLLFFVFFASSLFSVNYFLYGTVGEGSQDAPMTTLVILDQDTGGVRETIGEIGYRLNGLAFDPTTYNLYGTTSSNDPNFPQGLVIIDRETGAGTPVGSNWPNPIVCLACNSDGQLYGWIEFSPGPQDDLVAIDKEDGTFVQYPDAGLSTRGMSLDFNQSGVLYLLNQYNPQPIYTVSLVDGQPTQVGTFNVPTDVAHHGKFNPKTWEFWAIGDWGNTNPRDLYIIDINTGNLIYSLPTVDNLHTIAFAFEAPLSQLSLMGVKGHNRFLTETEYFNTLKWTLSTSVTDMVGFQLYRNGKLIAELPPSAREYVDHNRKRKESTEYSVKVIDLFGEVIDLTSVIVR
ncbi:MAG: hypothetical protein KFB95_01985 [Simkaniaceae bacterium]|nr:MAG: hypothetical protein KFB95_01985 [Simkaniaceae bacterium]